jgi:hypothetical protein
MTCRDLQALLSRMTWASQMVLVLASCQAPIRALIRGAAAPGARIRITHEASASMHACVDMLRSCNGSSVVPRADLVDDAPTYSCDASTWGFGFICDATKRYASEPWPAEMPPTHITKLELVGASVGMIDTYDAVLAGTGVAPRAVRSLCDNTAACACVSSLGTSSLTMAPLTRALATAAAARSFTPLSTYVQTALNPSDAPSRGVIPSSLRSSSWSRVRYSPSAILRLVTEPSAAALVATA